MRGPTYLPLNRENSEDQMGNELADRWMQQIPQMEGQIEKTDMVICEQVNDELSGTIQRLLPESERVKRWNFSAKCMSELVLGT